MGGPTFAQELRALVRDDRVHRSLYTDPKIFALEMERIFERTWIYVGHDSQIPNEGDFVTSYIGREQIILIRGKAGERSVLLNRCPHRGANVVTEEAGNTG